MCGHQMEKFDWIEYATKKFHEYKKEAHHYAAENEDIPELALINAGKGSALYELLKAAGYEPDMNDD